MSEFQVDKKVCIIKNKVSDYIGKTGTIVWREDNLFRIKLDKPLMLSASLITITNDIFDITELKLIENDQQR